jgi:hypothetical protein
MNRVFQIGFHASISSTLVLLVLAPNRFFRGLLALWSFLRRGRFNGLDFVVSHCSCFET